MALSRRAFLASAAAAGVAACSSSPPNAASSSSIPSVGSSAGTTTSAPAGPARFISTGPTGRNQVALTFHTAGTLAHFEALEAIFEARQVKITAFMVGTFLDANLDAGRRLVANGHELANHTYTHPTFANLAPTAMADEIARCQESIAKVHPDGDTYFRPSGTADGVTVPSDAVMTAATNAGYATVLGYDVDPADYADPGAAAVQQRVIGALHDGAVISMHFDHQGTVDAMPAILDAIDARGFKAVTASELLRA